MADEMLKNAQPQELESQIGEEDGLKEQLLRMCRQNKLAAFSAVLILVVILMAIFAPALAPYGEAEQDLISRLQGPSAAHWFGTDELGRDVFSRILYGSRLSLTIGILPSIISLVVGIFFGLLAGYFGGWVDYVIMRLADIMLSIPSLLLAMVVMYTLGQSTVNLFIALSLTSWASVARVVRSQTLSLKELAGYPLICLNEESMTRSFYRQFFLEHDAVLKPDTEAATTDQMLTLVKSELGLAFMPEPMAAPLLASGELVQLHLQEIIPSRSICLVYDHHRPLNTAARKFQQLLTKAGARSTEHK